MGVTVILVTCSYKEREFVRIGYYVNNEYLEEYDEEVGPPKQLDMTKVQRQILADKPRVTKFAIPWTDDAAAAAAAAAENTTTTQDAEMSVDETMKPSPVSPSEATTSPQQQPMGEGSPMKM